MDTAIVLEHYSRVPCMRFLPFNLILLTLHCIRLVLTLLLAIYRHNIALSLHFTIRLLCFQRC